MYKTRVEIDKFVNSLSGWQLEICKKLRESIHKCIPNGYEDWKWGANFKNSKGNMVANIGAFKSHIAIVFHEGAQIEDKYHLFLYEDSDNKRTRKIKFFGLEDLTDEKLKQIEEYLIELKDLSPTPKETKKVPDQKIPKDIEQIFQDKDVLEDFKKLANSHQREYLTYITEAKKEETKQKRIERSIERIREGLAYY